MRGKGIGESIREIPGPIELYQKMIIIKINFKNIINGYMRYSFKINKRKLSSKYSKTNNPTHFKG